MRGDMHTELNLPYQEGSELDIGGGMKNFTSVMLLDWPFKVLFYRISLQISYKQVTNGWNLL